MLFTEPVANTRVEVCVQLPCALVGAEQMADKLARALEIKMEGPPYKAHGHTADHNIELHTTVECFGACHRAPMCRVSIQHSGVEYREHIKTNADIQALASDLQRGA